MTYTLNVTETSNKSAKFHYQVKDENGNIISERNSNREYVACTINGSYYFGRVDLIGKADHGKAIKYNSGYGWDARRSKLLPNQQPINQKALDALNTIAYKK